MRVVGVANPRKIELVACCSDKHNVAAGIGDGDHLCRVLFQFGSSERCERFFLGGGIKDVV
jgi:hypothetical protein